MKIIDGFEFINIDNKTMAVSTGDAASVFEGVVSLNKTAYKIWKFIGDGLSLEETAARLSDEYKGLSYDKAYSYVNEFAEKLIEKGILIKD